MGQHGRTAPLSLQIKSKKKPVTISVQFSCSVMSDSLQPHGLQHARLPLSIANFRSLLKLKSIKSVMLSNHLIFCHPLLLLPSIFPSIRVFFSKSDLSIRWPKYWSFSFSISPFNDFSGLISFRTDWFDLLAVQGTLKSSPTPQFKTISCSVTKSYQTLCYPMNGSPSGFPVLHYSLEFAQSHVH